MYPKCKAKWSKLETAVLACDCQSIQKQNTAFSFVWTQDLINGNHQFINYRTEVIQGYAL